MKRRYFLRELHSVFICSDGRDFFSYFDNGNIYVTENGSVLQRLSRDMGHSPDWQIRVSIVGYFAINSASCGRCR